MSDADALRERLEALERVVAEVIGWPTGTRTPTQVSEWSRLSSAMTPDAAIRERATQLDSR